jgi:U3 small nucleolar RNA-associated protein 19
MQRAALQALKMFFIESSHESPIMHVSNFPLDPNGASNAPAPASDAQAVYQAWVQRQHNTYLDALFNLVTAEQHSASIQVAAASAVMEAVRSAGGAGVLVPDLLLRLVQAMATAPGVKPEVFTLFFTRYFQYADVRYYSLISIKHIASIQSSRRSSSAPAAAGGGGQQAAPSSSGAQQKLQGRQGAGTKDSLPVPASSSAADGKGTNNSSEPSTSENGTTLSGGDVFRNLFDMLAAMPDPPSSTSDSEAPGKGKVQEGDDDEDQPALRSWCGLAETVGVAAAPDKNESSKARRKRKAAEALAQEKAAKRGPGAAAAAAASQQRVAWANPKNQRRVYRWGMARGGEPGS